MTQAQLDIALAELSALQSLKAADCVLSAPEDGTLTQLNLEAGQNSTSVAGASCGSERCQCTDLFSFGTGVGPPCHGGNTDHCEARKPVYADNHYGFVRSIGRWKYTNYRYVKLRRLEGGKCYGGNQTECRTVRTMPSGYSNSNGQLWYVCLPGGKRATLLGIQNVLIRLPVTVEAQGDGMAAVSGSISGQVVTGADKPLSEGSWVRVAS